jgi:hypothetical protein
MMHDKPRFLLIVVQSAIIALLLLYLIFSFDDSFRASALEEHISELEEIKANCLERNDSLSAVLQELRITGAIPPFLDRVQIEKLVNRGLANPADDLRKDLTGRPDIINIPPVLGGKMAFYFYDGIHILNERRMLAYFEDGHVAGAILLKYDIGQDGRISWEVLDETLY